MKPNPDIGDRFEIRPHHFGLIVFFLSLLFTQTLWAEQNAGSGKGDGFEICPRHLKKIDNQVGGHFKFKGDITGYDTGSYFEPLGTNTGLDGLANARLTDKLIVSENVYVQAHYEAFLKFGDTCEKLYAGGLAPDTSNMDKRRVFDLTQTVKETADYVLWHRLDRLLFSIKASRGDIIVGRQAVTWGNGLIFNPMDLFNPFSPSDTDRDYKMGDDLVSVRFTTQGSGECNLLYVPRRDVRTGEVDFKSSSIAGKTHFFIGDMEMDIMGALHYNETVLGIGAAGYLGDAAWRWDLVWSTVDDAKNGNGYVEVVANMDYSWVWFQKNLYGLIEYYHNGLGKNNYTNAMQDPEVVERIDRGELFALGKNYVSGQIQVELHPLLNVYVNVINNVRDPSGIVQPRAVWNATQNSNLQFGANFYYGKQGSEYGGFLIPGTTHHTNAAPSAYVLLTTYF